MNELHPQYLYYLCLAVVGAPLLGAVITGLNLSRLSLRTVHLTTILFMALSCVSSTLILIGCLHDNFLPQSFNLYTWAGFQSFTLTVGFLVDRLSALMISVVSFVSLMVHIYSVGYMVDDPGNKRFFCYISLFTFAMLMLVLANNAMQLFFGWEGVGLLSYLLISFWFKREPAIFAGLKAFIVNRIGDFGFILGIAAIFSQFGSLDYQAVFSQITPQTPTTLICCGLLLGAMAKSAQIPLHVWLPDSMEGPTPISALIHAATMVTAGIFMVARLSPLFENSTFALSSMIFLGSITCMFMGILGIVQKDIKRIIAYSTLSQLGYMFVALGVSAYAASMFHLVTHAFFKSLLFLGAGSVIIAMHHEQDIFKMGNLRKYMPITFVTMVIASLALTGFPGTAGFYSKDLIIEACAYSNVPLAKFGYYMTLFSVFVTALYTFRLLFLVFFTNERMPSAVANHLHDTKTVILAPLCCLAVPSLLLGIIMINPVLTDLFKNSLTVLPEHAVLNKFQTGFHGAWQMFAHGLISVPFMLLVAGCATAWVFYIKYPTLPQRLQTYAKTLHAILIDKYGFDALNENYIVPAIRKVGSWLWQQGDQQLIDGVAVNGTANSINKIAQRLRALQSGYLYDYVFIMLAGILALLLYLFYTRGVA